MPRKHSKYNNTKAHRGNTNKGPLLRITLPLHLTTETELAALHKQFTQLGNQDGLALIEPELAQRRHETTLVALQQFDTPAKKNGWIQDWDK